ncbi:hypothetical protein DL767_004737 [Monosporascus sp. MG133]|nr:hypothetical protein DL767_004737 [Monosporascus sp. MG133]
MRSYAVSNLRFATALKTGMVAERKLGLPQTARDAAPRRGERLQERPQTKVPPRESERGLVAAPWVPAEPASPASRVPAHASAAGSDYPQADGVGRMLRDRLLEQRRHRCYAPHTLPPIMRAFGSTMSRCSCRIASSVCVWSSAGFDFWQAAYAVTSTLPLPLRPPSMTTGKKYGASENVMWRATCFIGSTIALTGLV